MFRQVNISSGPPTDAASAQELQCAINRYLRKKYGDARFKAGLQQDARDFLMTILEIIGDCPTGLQLRAPACWKRGKTVQCTYCRKLLRCGHETETILHLKFPEACGAQAIERLLELYLEPEVIGTGCECNLRAAGFIQRWIKELPDVVLVHVHPQAWKGVKIPARLLYSMELDVAPQCIPPSPVRADDTQLCKGGMRFRLCAVVEHTGKDNDGHYTTYRLGPLQPDAWWHMNDAKKASQCDPGTVSKAQAFMLLYERLPAEDRSAEGTTSAELHALVKEAKLGVVGAECAPPGDLSAAIELMPNDRPMNTMSDEHKQRIVPNSSGGRSAPRVVSRSVSMVK